MSGKKFLPLHKFWIAGLLTLFVATAVPTWAQDYRFYVPSLNMNVYIQPDASARIVYDITFRNGPQAHAIDVVDIGVPHSRYDMKNMKAAIDGTPLTDIRHSEYVKPGVEIHLGGHSIKGGAQGNSYLVRETICAWLYRH
jgi:hypothetical protein